jgi:hypothetical protein
MRVALTRHTRGHAIPDTITGRTGSLTGSPGSGNSRRLVYLFLPINQRRCSTEHPEAVEPGCRRRCNSTRTPEQYADRVGQRCQPKPIRSVLKSLMTQNLSKEGFE